MLDSVLAVLPKMLQYLLLVIDSDYNIEVLLSEGYCNLSHMVYLFIKALSLVEL